MRFLPRALMFVLIVALGVAVAKVAQYAAVDLLGDRLGFDLASLAGVAPVLIAMLYLAKRFPRRPRNDAG